LIGYYRQGMAIRRKAKWNRIWTEMIYA
jgi:hypothetical protein